ncbi:MAG: DUF3108 domain-containing protein [Cyclobacteriaceae bacterium]
MKKLRILFPVLLLLLLSAFTLVSELSTYRNLENKSFGSGERLEYKIHVGLLNAAHSTMYISDTIYQLNGRPCFKIDVQGKTSGVFDFFIRVRDQWGSYLDTTAIIPHQFYRNIEEGKYRKYEVVEFDHDLDSAIVLKMDKHTRKLKERKSFNIKDDSQDLISGYYYMRTLDYSKFNIGDTLKVPAFFDDENYEFKTTFVGREEVRTKLGKVHAIVLSPIMPENSIFDGENAIRIWLSDDQNKIPLKVKAKMFVGSVEIDITDGYNLKSPLALVE